MNTLSAGMCAVAASVVLAGPARAQLPHLTPFAFEVRAGAAFPTGDFNDDANTGYTLNGNVTAYVIPVLGIYGGYHYTRFGHSGEGHYNETGPEVGLRLDIPTPTVPLDPYVKVGVVWNHLELTGAGVDDFSDTSAGIQFNGGIALTLKRISLTPAFTYVRYGYDTDTQSGQTASYIRADLGVRVRI
jgi:Outer membrane protein beta-barrel domain